MIEQESIGLQNMIAVYKGMQANIPEGEIHSQYCLLEPDKLMDAMQNLYNLRNQYNKQRKRMCYGK